MTAVTLERDLREGGIVSLVVTWGSQSRHNCPNCQRFTSGGSVVQCRGCGAVYRRIQDTTDYFVEVLP